MLNNILINFIVFLSLFVFIFFVFSSNIYVILLILILLYFLLLLLCYMLNFVYFALLLLLVYVGAIAMLLVFCAMLLSFNSSLDFRSPLSFYPYYFFCSIFATFFSLFFPISYPLYFNTDYFGSTLVFPIIPTFYSKDYILMGSFYESDVISILLIGFLLFYVTLSVTYLLSTAKTLKKQLC